MTTSLDDVKTSSHAARHIISVGPATVSSVLHCGWQRATALQHRPPWSSYPIADAALYLLAGI